MNPFYELWDTESGNLLNSFNSFVDAWETMASAIGAGKIDWAENAVLAIRLDCDDAPHLMMRGSEIVSAVLRERNSNEAVHIEHNYSRPAHTEVSAAIQYGSDSAQLSRSIRSQNSLRLAVA